MGVIGGNDIPQKIQTGNRGLDLELAFRKAAAMPAPERDLALPNARPLARETLKNNNTVFFGETHDDTNLKFLADNPAFFNEAAAMGVRHVFIELPVTAAPAFKNFFDGKLSKQDFEGFLAKSTGEYTSGDTVENFARQIADFCQMAKNNGMNVLPSDFRVLETGIDLYLTSDAVGIPDITGRNDETRHQVQQSLRDYQEKYGLAYPLTDQQMDDLIKIHKDRLAQLPAEITARLDVEKEARAKDWQTDDSDPVNIRNNDRLQFAYYSRLVAPGEKSVFFGGSDHFSHAGTIDNLLQENGYGGVAGIRLLSQAGLLNEELIAYEKTRDAENAGETPPSQRVDQFSYTIHTESGLVLDDNFNISNIADRDSGPTAPIAQIPAAEKPQMDQRQMVF